MEAQELLFNIVEGISSAVLIVEQKEDSKYSQSYMNKVMSKLLRQESNGLEAKKKSSSSDGFPKVLQQLLERYENEASTDSYTMHDVEIFNKFYNIVFNKKEKYIFIVFSENRAEEFFNNVTFHDLSQSCNAIVVVIDDQGNVADMNSCFLELVGKDRESVCNKNFFESFIPGDREKLDGYFEHILSNDDHHQHFVTPLKGAYDNIYKINWQVSKIKKNDHTFVIAVGSDISKFINENSELKKQIKSIRIGFEYFPFAVGYMNAKGCFTRMNPRFMEMFNISKEDEDVTFDKVSLLSQNIDFNEMNEHIKLIKEMSYKIDSKDAKLKVDIRLLTGSKKSSKFYIVVAQKV